MVAYRHAGVSLPRTTYEMLASPKLERIPRADARWGDLAFYGTGHVELYMGPANWTFGAHSSGTRIGRIVFGPYWHPTMYFRVR
jgi:cell wall-associated NlpC family hydrolase